MQALTFRLSRRSLLIFAIFYFLLIRPQQQQAKKLREAVENVRRGDTVVLASAASSAGWQKSLKRTIRRSPSRSPTTSGPRAAQRPSAKCAPRASRWKPKPTRAEICCRFPPGRACWCRSYCWRHRDRVAQRVARQLAWLANAQLPSGLRLPKNTVSLGLDLQGGSNILLEVELDQALKDRLNSTLGDIRRALRKAHIGYNFTPRRHDLGVKIIDPAQFDDAQLGDQGSQPVARRFGAVRRRAAIRHQPARRRHASSMTMTDAYKKPDQNPTSSRSPSKWCAGASTIWAPRSPASNSRARTASWCRCPACRTRRELVRAARQTTAKMTFQLVDESADVAEALQRQRADRRRSSAGRQKARATARTANARGRKARAGGGRPAQDRGLDDQPADRPGGRHLPLRQCRRQGIRRYHERKRPPPLRHRARQEGHHARRKSANRSWPAPARSRAISRSRAPRNWRVCCAPAPCPRR